MLLWKLRSLIAEKFNIASLAGRHSELQFSDDKIVILPGYELKKNAEELNIDKKQIFLHIPKTAGTTVISVLEAILIYTEKKYARAVIKDYSPPIAIIPGWHGSWEDVSSRSDDYFHNADLISGHFPFGLHNKLNGDYRYFTFVRDPISRELSSYNYLYQTGAIEKDEDINMHFERMIDNPQVRIIAGIDAMSGECTEATYQKAIDNLNSNFSLYAPSEDADNALNYFISVNKWPVIAYRSFNVTRKKLVNKASASLKESLSEKHCYDIKLHEYVKDKWSKFKANNIKCLKEVKGDTEIISLDRNFTKNKSFKFIKKIEINTI